MIPFGNTQTQYYLDVNLKDGMKYGNLLRSTQNNVIYQ